MTNSKFTASSLVLAIAAVAVLVGGTTAQADPVQFDNPAHGETGHFHWPIQAPETNYLDIAQDASVQPAGAANGLSSFGQVVKDSSVWGRINASAGVAELAANADGLLLSLSAGTTISSTTDAWWGGAWIYRDSAGGTLLPEGVPTYLGVRFNGPNWQYGWIGVERTGLELETFAWGYEIEVGVPIEAGAVPEPGTLAMLAVGAVGVLRRRR